MRKINISSVLTVALATASFAGAQAAAPAMLSEAGTPGKIAKAPAYAAEESWEDIGEGIFSDPVICNEFSGYYNDPVKVKVQRSVANPNLYKVLEPWPNIAEVWPGLELRPDDNFMIVDTTEPDFVLVYEGALPFEDAVNGEVRYQSMTNFAAMKGFTKEQFLASPLGEGNITMSENGMITFPMNCFGVMYPYGVDETPNVWVPTMGNYSGYLVLPGGEFEDEWESMGTGQMLEGMVWTVFEDAAPVEKDVEIFKHKETEGIYKIAGAFTDSYEEAADLVIDARDPEWVRIEKFDTRINTEYGHLYILSVSANNYASYDDMVSFDPDFANRNITLKDNYLDIPAKSVYLHFPEYDSMSVQVNDRSVPCYVKFPGYSTSAMTVGSDEAEAEYYNLMGMRIQKPAAGQIVIERRGDKVSKKVMH